jgi:hypothetical protein
MDKRRRLADLVTADIIYFFMRDRELPADAAMRQFYDSEVFGKLQDLETGLYRESSAYVYDLYKTELEYGRLVQLEQ